MTSKLFNSLASSRYTARFLLFPSKPHFAPRITPLLPRRYSAEGGRSDQASSHVPMVACSFSMSSPSSLALHSKGCANH